MFYTYLWLREDGTPYYVGKGKGNRAFNKDMHRQFPPPKDRVVIYPAESESDAFETEVALIWYYGRKDLGTGCLRNLTDGGEGSSGVLRTAQWSSLQSKVHMGQRKGKPWSENRRKAQTEEVTRKISEASKGRTSARKGKQHTEESKRKNSEAHKGKRAWNKGIVGIYTGTKNPFYGKHHSEETKRKISEAKRRRLSQCPTLP